MRTLTVVGTGSTGNAYLLQIDNDKLLLDAGVRISEIKKALNWSIGGLQGVVISHAHR